MKEYRREHPRFALCGLNCGLCPRFHTDGVSRCPGCGGPDFHLKHPSCAVITCARKHGAVEFCHACADFPCERYGREFDQDSFISYRNVLADFKKAKAGGLDDYLRGLDRRMAILEYLLETCDDGRRKSFYCHSANLLPLADLESALAAVKKNIAGRNIERKEKAILTVERMEEAARRAGIELKLRK